MAERLAPGLRRVLAPNPGPLTGPGTNSYIVGQGRVAVIDPGPDDPAHLAALEAALAPGERITHVVVTHAHRDHSPLARPLADRWGAQVAAFGDARAGRNPAFAGLAALGGGEGVDAGFVPDLCLADGAEIAGGDPAPWRLRALWTPGHMGNHLCLLWDDVAFSGDHVMGWASTVVSPPDGDMAAYMNSLRQLLERDDARYHPTHGPAIVDPATHVRELIAHRENREAQILACVRDGILTIPEMVERMYATVDRRLHPAARHSVLAHVIHMVETGRLACDGPPAMTTALRLP